MKVYKTSLTIFCSPILFYLFVHMSPSAEMTMLIVLGERPYAHTVVLHSQFEFKMLLYFQVYASI